jgi:O-succinylbenzoate synthase
MITATCLHQNRAYQIHWNRSQNDLQLPFKPLQVEVKTVSHVVLSAANDAMAVELLLTSIPPVELRVDAAGKLIKNMKA